jgi:hypothetical protein
VPQVQNLADVTFASYRSSISALPRGRLTQRHLLNDDYLIGYEGELQVFYAPFDAISTTARLVLVGITPGWQQMRLAFEACRDALVRGGGDRDCLAAAKETAAFAGMRTRIVGWLDELGVAAWLDIESTSALFEDRHDLLHSTSAIRYPTFVGDDRRNYSGHTPSPRSVDLLMSIVRARLVPELGTTPEALVVPMGRAASQLLESLPEIDLGRCLVGFPHPSSANGHAGKQFAQNRELLREKVSTLSA